VKENATRVLAVRAASRPLTPEVEYQDLVQLLSEDSKHEVLKNGVRLGKQLVELVEGEEAAWAMLAGFWAEMILYVAPSKNLRGHSMAIARGGELITLLWVLLFHVGIVSRPDLGPDARHAGDDGVHCCHQPVHLPCLHASSWVSSLRLQRQKHGVSGNKGTVLHHKLGSSCTVSTLMRCLPSSTRLE